MDIYERESGAAQRATSDTLAQMVQLWVTIAAIAAMKAAEAREERYQRARDAELEQARIENEKLRAERAAAEPLMREAWQQRFWEDPDPRRIGRAWQAAAEWAGTDTYAQATIDHLRKQLTDRLGVEVPRWSVGGPEVARMVMVSDPQFQKVLEEARTALQEARQDAGQVSFVILIQDLDDPYQALYRSQVFAGLGVAADTLAAEQFQQWAAEAGREVVESRGAGKLSVAVLENTGEDAAAQVPAAQVRGDAIESILAADTERQRRIVAGTEPDATDAEVLRAVENELARLQEDESERLRRRTDFAARLEDSQLSRQDRVRLQGNVDAIDGGLPALRDAQAEMALRVQATAAQMRGENPQLVYQAQHLNEALDAGWWQTASAHEIAGVWEHVSQWSDGRAREETQALLRENVERHYALTLPAEADAQIVGELLGGREGAEPARTWDQRAQDFYDQGQALYEEAFDALHQALLKEAEAGAEASGEEATEQLHAEALQLRERAASDQEHAGEFIQQARWLDTRMPEAVDAAVESGDTAAVAELRDEFQKRWGYTPEPAMVEQVVQEAATEGGALRMPTGIGSADPTALPTLVAGVDSGMTEAVDVEEQPTMEREAENRRRRRQAQETLEAMADQEAAEAVRVGAMGYPRGPEAAVETLPKTVASKNPPSPGPEVTPSLER